VMQSDPTALAWRGRPNRQPIWKLDGLSLTEQNGGT
jgi:hypothetical protein